MTPGYERIAIQLQHTPILSLGPVETSLLITAAIGAALLLYTLYEAIKCKMLYRQWRIKDLVIHALGLIYIKKWMQENLFLFLGDDTGWNAKQQKWLEEKQKQAEVQKKLNSVERQINNIQRITNSHTKPPKINMKTIKGFAKYECKECGYKDQMEMPIYTEIIEAAKTLSCKQLCLKCKGRRLEVVMMKCKLLRKN